MLSSAYLPIAGVMIPENMYQALLAESKKIGVFGHGFTYGGHPVSAAVALKAIEIYARDRIFETAAARAPQFQARLQKLNAHPLVGEARGLGLIGGVGRVELLEELAVPDAVDVLRIEDAARAIHAVAGVALARRLPGRRRCAADRRRGRKRSPEPFRAPGCA